jgi:hypothetical protein
VGEGPIRDPRRAGFETGDWYIHDGLTGERRFGPIKGVGVATARAFSPDGRWFWADRRKSSSSSESLRGLCIFYAATGEEAVTLHDEPDMMTGQCRFAPDSLSVAVSWWDKKITWPDRRLMIQIIDLPSRRERLRVELPKRPWIRIERWDGRRLFAVERLPPDETKTEEERCWEFDTSRDPIGEGSLDPLLVGHKGSPGTPNSHWFAGNDWAAFFSFLPANRPPKSKFEEWRDWLATQLGIDMAPSKRMQLSGRFVDRPSGAIRYELPRAVSHGVFISDDGRRMVCPRGDDAIEVWDVHPPSRWPKALGAGAVVAACFLGFGRWRRRRELARTPHPPPCLIS